MNIQDLIGGAAAAVIGPHDTVVITIDRYLTGAQLEVIGGYFRKRLLSNQVIVLQKGMSVEVWTAAEVQAYAQKVEHAKGGA